MFFIFLWNKYLVILWVIFIIGSRYFSRWLCIFPILNMGKFTGFPLTPFVSDKCRLGRAVAVRWPPRGTFCLVSSESSFLLMCLYPFSGSYLFSIFPLKFGERFFINADYMRTPGMELIWEAFTCWRCLTVIYHFSSLVIRNIFLNHWKKMLFNCNFGELYFCPFDIIELFRSLLFANCKQFSCLCFIRQDNFLFFDNYSKFEKFSIFILFFEKNIDWKIMKRGNFSQKKRYYLRYKEMIFPFIYSLCVKKNHS